MFNPPPSENKTFNWIWIEWAHRLWRYLQNELRSTGSVALTTGVTSTVVSDNTCRVASKVFLMPADSGASSGFGTNTIYISAVADGSFTITHTNSGSTRTFFYLIINE